MWLLFLAIALILLFIFFLTRKPLKTLTPESRHASHFDSTPWGVAQYGVSEEALLPFEGGSQKMRLFDAMLERMGALDAEELVLKSILFGLELASQSDDYGKVGIEFEADARVEKLMQETEIRLADSKAYSQHKFYAQSIIVIQDMLESAKTEDDRQVLRKALENYTAKIKSLESELHREFKGIDRQSLGTKRDREEFYFKMGVTNYLRSKNVAPALDQLYRIYGVNYQVEDAFRAVMRELPLFEKLMLTGIDQIQSWRLLELKQFIHSHFTPEKSLPTSPSD